MPVTIQPNDVITAKLQFSDESALGDVALNVLHYQVKNITVSASGLPSAIAIPWEAFGIAAGQVFYEQMGDTWKAFASEDVVMDGVEVQKVYGSPRSNPMNYTPVDLTSGVILGDALPMQDSVTVLKRTGFGERWGQGRVFVTGIPELHAEGGRLIPAGVTNLASFIDKLFNTFTVSDGTYDTTLIPVLYQKSLTSLRITPITNCVLSNNIIKTQRRRRPGKGS